MSDDLRDRLAAALKDKRWLACRDAEGDRYFRFASEHELADAVLAVVQEEQDAYEATTEQQLQDTLRHLGRAERARDRYRLAWQSARFRAQAYGEGILRAVDDRDAYKGWMEQAQAEVIRLTGLLSEYSDRAIANGQRAEKAEAERDAALATLARVRELHQRYRHVGAVGDDDSCAHCNQLAGLPVPWPCPTVLAIDAALAGPAGAGSTQDGA